MYITENLAVDFGEDHKEKDPHIVRIGWSVDSHNFQLGNTVADAPHRARSLSSDTRGWLTRGSLSLHIIIILFTPFCFCVFVSLFVFLQLCACVCLYVLAHLITRCSNLQ